MNNLIVYATKYGTTKKCAESIASFLENSTVINCKDSKTINVDDYDQIIIGSSVYIGNSRKAIKKFIKSHYLTLRQKKIALFICSAQTDDFEKLFSPELTEKAFLKAHLGHEILFSQMNKLDRYMMKKVGGSVSDTSEIKYDAIENFAKSLSK